MNSSVPVSYRTCHWPRLPRFAAMPRFRRTWRWRTAVTLTRRLRCRLKDRDEGTVSSTDGDFKVSVTYKGITQRRYRPAPGALGNKSATTPGTHSKWNAGLNTKHFRALQELNAPDLATVRGFITTKPASPA